MVQARQRVPHPRPSPTTAPPTSPPADNGIRFSWVTDKDHTTFFHETGHMLDWILGDEARYLSSGTGSRLGATLFKEAQDYRKTAAELVRKNQQDIELINELSASLKKNGHLTTSQLNAMTSKDWITNPASMEGDGHEGS